MNLEIKDLKLVLGDNQILQIDSFSYSGKGELISIIGPNGSGKTSLLRCITGVYRKIYCGSIKISGDELRGLSHREISYRIGMMHQEFQSIYDYRVKDLLQISRYSRPSMDPDLFKSIINKFNLKKYLYRRVKELSTGERQLVQAGMLLYQDPEICVFDEPVSHLDPLYRHRILMVLKDLCQSGKTVFAVFHDINTGLKLGEKVLAIKAGKVFFFGSGSDLLKDGILSDLFDMDYRLVKTDSNEDLIFFD